MKTTRFVLQFALIWVLASCNSATPTPTTTTPLTATLPQPTVTSTPSPVELVWNINGDPNQFNTPASLAVDEGGNLYVLDAENNRIQVFDKDGKFVMMWGVLGTGNGEFNFQRGAGDYVGGVALDAEGNVYVTDNANQRVQKFDSSGDFLLKWGSKGTEDGQFISPYEVTVDGQGNVYVIDDRRDDVQKFDSNGNFLLKWGGHGTSNGQLSNTGGIAVDGQGNVYVADFGNNRIQKFDSNGVFLLKWGSKGGGNNQLDGPTDVAVDVQGNVYVTNLVPHEESPPRIQKFDSDGKFLARWGSLGTGDGQFITPGGIAVDNEGNVYVADLDNNNVQKFLQK